MIPELVDTGTIHIDAFLGSQTEKPERPYKPLSRLYERTGSRNNAEDLYRYWRDKGIDVTSEWAYGLRDDRFVGLQPWCWHQEDKVADLPDELYCSTKWVGCDMWFIEDLMNPPTS
jgi:hypothetical protein